MPAESESPPPAYGSWPAGPSDLDASEPWLATADPRRNSTQSLAPSYRERDSPRRRLLLIYIHGYQGNNTSFKQFPFHIHRYLRECLDSHVIHTKIYPRYKTYRSIEVARDNFGAWLEPHESEDTDVVLMGHSMGGLLAAEVALAPNRSPYGHHPYKHRILGTVSLDAPLLGLHLGIIPSGIASLFRSKSPPPGTPGSQDQPTSPQPTSPQPPSSGRHSSGYLSSQRPGNSDTETLSLALASVEESDPNFNPQYFNDVEFQERPFGQRLLRFVQKHSSDGLVDAVAQHFQSHLQYGGCLMDITGLNRRYETLRALEDVDEFKSSGGGSSGRVRIRFVNYYTLCYGRSTREGGGGDDEPAEESRGSALQPAVSSAAPPDADPTQSPSRVSLSTPRISIEDHSDPSNPDTVPIPIHDHGRNYDHKDNHHDRHDSEQGPNNRNDDDAARDEGVKRTDENRPISGCDTPSIPQAEAAGSEETHPTEPSVQDTNHPNEPDPSSDPGLPQIPALPDPPAPTDYGRFTNKEERRQAEKEDKRARKVYAQAVKDRDKAIRERQKLVEKREKERQKERQKETERQAKLAKKQQLREEAEAEKRAKEEVEAQKRAREKSEALMRTKEEAEAQKRARGEDTPGNGQPEGGGPAEPAEAERKPPKERKFCALPRKVDGVRDQTWVPVMMGNVDEVEAHCGLFLAGPHYERLVGDVGSRIIDWVHADLARRAIAGMVLDGSI